MQYHDDPQRIDAIEQIMTQAFGIAGRVLADDKADEILPGWLTAFRTVPTDQLEQVRIEGLKRRCTTAEQFVTVFEARMQSIAVDAQWRAQQAQFERERQQATKPGVPSPGRDRVLAKWRQEGLIA